MQWSGEIQQAHERKAQDLEHYFIKFFDTKNPEKAFLDVSIELPKVTDEQYLIISNGVQEYQEQGMR